MSYSQTKPKKRKIMRGLKINEISAVDKAAQVPAEALLMKRAQSATEKGMGLTYDRPMLTTTVDGHAHILDDVGQGGETSYTRSEGEEYGHTHPWVRMLDGSLTIGAAEGHSHTVVELTAPSTKSAGRSGGSPNQGKNPMTKQDKDGSTAAEGNEAVVAMQKSIAELTTRAERAEAISKLDASQRPHFDGLKTEAQTAFLAKSVDERASEIRAASEANRVVYKSSSGQEYRANDDQRLVELAKQGDIDRAAAKTAQDSVAMAGFEKRAATELPSLPGTDAVKAGILKALEGVAGAPEFLKAANEGAKGAFTSMGAKGGEVLKADDQLEVLAVKYAADNKVTIVKARAAVLETPEGSKLYQELSA